MLGKSFLPGSFCPQAPQSILCREEELEPMGKDVAHTASFTWVSWNIKPPHKKNLSIFQEVSFTWFEGHDWSRDQGRHEDNHPEGSSEKENIKRRLRTKSTFSWCSSSWITFGCCDNVFNKSSRCTRPCLHCLFLIYKLFYAIITMSSQLSSSASPSSHLCNQIPPHTPLAVSQLSLYCHQSVKEG